MKKKYPPFNLYKEQKYYISSNQQKKIIVQKGYLLLKQRNFIGTFFY